MADKLVTKTLSLSDLLPNPRNPRQHDEKQFEHLVASLVEFGQTKPILVRKANHMIIAGHGIYEAATRAGLAELDCRIWDVDQKKADAFMLADNRLGDLSSDDDKRVAALLQDIEGFSHQALGYTDDEVDELLADLEERQVQLYEIPTGEVDDKFWVSLRGPLERQADVLEKVKAILTEYPDLELEQGNINIGA